MENIKQYFEQKKTDLPKQFPDNMSSNIIDDPIKIATKFNDYFVNLGPKLAKNINNTNTAFDKYLTKSIPNSFFFGSSYRNEVRNEIGKVNATKSPGYDGLSAKIIKLVGTEISKPITQIFNQTFLTGNIPHQLKIALQHSFISQMKTTNLITTDQFQSSLILQNY